MDRRTSCRLRVVAVACAGLVALLGAAAAVSADQPGQAPPGTSQPRSSPDFFFGRPRGAVGLRGAWLFATAGSDIYDFVTGQLTLDDGAFDTPSLSGDLAITITKRVDLVFGFETSETSTGSEYRDFVDNNGLPIEQDTSLSIVDLTAGAKVMVGSRGRGVSRYAWIPSTFTPYVGGGIGALRYKFEQTGDFVDFADLSVFTSTFASEGWTLSAHVLGGLDVRVFRKLYFTTEARYVWASADLDDDFVGFEPIDLSGLRCGAGIRLVF